MIPPNFDHEKYFELGNQLRDRARSNSNESSLYKEAAKKFSELANIDNELANLMTTSQINRTIYAANREHVLYERDLCLFLYHFSLKELEIAEPFINSMTTHINNAIKLIKCLRNMPNVHPLIIKNSEIDEKRWIYNCLLISTYKHMFKWKKATLLNNHEQALDELRECQNELESLISNYPEYATVIELEYKRIMPGNQEAFLSNEKMQSFFSLNNNHENSEVNDATLIHMIHLLLEAYEHSCKAIRINPFAKDYSVVMNNQREILIELLIKEKKRWALIYIEFEHHKELLQLMKRADSKKFKKTQKELMFNDNSMARLWSFGSLLLTLFLFVIISLTIVSKTSNGLWTIPIFLATEAIVLILVGVLLVFNGNITQSSLLEIIKQAFRFQFLVFRLKTSQDKPNNQDIK
ncbi:hypothetical protein ACI48J_16415 [Paenibacillus chitinolyticus]|uniref:hypothetical protein n=1 Tax=Paenibacillus chitinolyticus TaxID=79263 RepID=UPI003869C6F4